MKKASLVLSAVLFSLLFTSPSHAAFLELYTVGSDGSTVAKNVFAPGETPFLYLKIPDNFINITSAFWISPSSLHHFDFEGVDGNSVKWLSLPNWNSVKENGNWNITANYFLLPDAVSSVGETAEAHTSFTVTPEPISTILFTVGALPFVARIARRRRVNA